MELENAQPVLERAKWANNHAVCVTEQGNVGTVMGQANVKDVMEQVK